MHESAFSSRKDEESLRVLQLDGERAVFAFRNVDVSVVSALRRSIMQDVATLAIHRVVIEQNTSKIFDEVIAHRLAFIPLRSNRVREFVTEENCSCETRCERCSVTLRLDVRAPVAQPEETAAGFPVAHGTSNTALTGPRGREMFDVYSDELRSEDSRVAPSPLPRSVAKFCDAKGLRVARLEPGQHIKLTAYAKKVRGCGATSRLLRCLARSSPTCKKPALS